MMNHLRDSEPIPVDELIVILRNHHLFITSGGGGGNWHTFSVGEGDATTVFGVYLERRTGDATRPVRLPDVAESLIREKVPPDMITGKQARLSHKRLEGPLLEKLFLPYADLCGIACIRQSLKNAFLEGSLLVDSDLTRSDFTGANLKNADLSRCDMAGVCMRNADLTGADLEEADLTGADLRGAVLERAKLKNTLMQNTIP